MEGEGRGVTPFVDLTPASFRAASHARRVARLWLGAYLGTGLVLGGSYLGVTAGASQRYHERDQLTSQLKLEWERNEEAQRLLKDIQQLEENITRYDRLASPVRVSDVVGTVAALLPRPVSLTAMTFVPRSERLAAKPASAKGGAKRPSQPQSVNYMAIELEGVAPSDGELAELVSALESSPLFQSVTMDFARSTSIDGVLGRAFRVSARVDFEKHYSFRRGGVDDGTSEEAPVSGTAAEATAEVSP